EGHRYQFLTGVPDDVAKPLVDLQTRSVWSDAGDADGGVLEDGLEPRLALADRLDALLTLAQALDLVEKPLAEFPARGLVRGAQKRFDKRFVLSQHRF